MDKKGKISKKPKIKRHMKDKVNTTESNTMKSGRSKNPKIKVFTKNNKQVQPETNIIDKLRERYNDVDIDKIKKFSDLPLSAKTLKGLRECNYIHPTDIQKQTVQIALQGKDILGAAQTGSGKTLAFLIPVLESLYCKQWTHLDGVGAIVITPTRELAYQIFETLRRIGEHHDFSAGLIIGGKDLKFERNRMDKCNIIICTPGRLLQHMDQNPLFDCVNMQILVLDEADRCLDMGFEQTMNAIIANLPLKRQTMLFSATQTKSVKDLARLSLKDPCYVSVHENSKYGTPEGLQQSYVVCNLQDKLSILWSFIKNHLKQKIIIFFSSCKQVKYMFEIFCKLRPGTSLLPLYGTLHQLRRMDIYENFCKKSSAVLFATDLAARGLDFPEVHWVVQADCPEDAATYIHRVGRTARYHRGGETLLLLLESELAILDDLKEKKVPVEKMDINPLKLNNPVRKMEAFLAKDPSLKDTAQRAFVSYVKAVFLMKNKKIFDVHALETNSYANSLGLAIPPRIRFLQRLNARNAKALPSNNKTYFKDDDEKGASDNQNEEDNYFEDNNQEDVTKESSQPFQVSDDESDDENSILKVKRKDHDIELPSEQELEDISSNKKKKAITKAAVAKKMLKKKIIPNKKIVFNEEGEAVLSGTKVKKSEIAQLYENEDVSGIDIEKAKVVLKEEDKFDKQLFREKVKARHKEQKRKLKEKKKQEQEEAKDEFGESSDEEPDLSWLPDPDKIYGKEGNDEDNEETGSISNDELKVKQFVKKQKRKNKTNSKKNKDESPHKPKKRKLQDVASALSGNEVEELAMMLLRNK